MSTTIDPSLPEVEVASTFHPSARIAWTVAAPIPREPPTIKAVFMLSLPHQSRHTQDVFSYIRCLMLLWAGTCAFFPAAANRDCDQVYKKIV
jgi:hypothetical protein